MPGKRLADLHGAALSHFQRIFNCQLELQKITWAIWKNETSLFGRGRSNALEGLDRELKQFHAKAASMDRMNVDAVEELALHAVVMYYAFNAWKNDPGDKNPARAGAEGWKYSYRNTSGIFERLHDILSRYTSYVSHYSAATIPASEAALFVGMQTAHEEAFVRMFKGAKVKAKSSFVREQLAAAAFTTGSAIAQRTGLTSLVESQIERGTDALGSLVAPVTSALSSAASTVQHRLDAAVVTVSESQFTRMLADAVGARFGHAGGDSTAHLLKEAIAGLNIADAWVRGALVTIAEKVGKAVYAFIKDFIPFAGAAACVAKAAQEFYKAIRARMDANEARRNTYVVRAGSTTDAYNAIVSFWDDDCKKALKDGGIALITGIAKGVCAAFPGVGNVVSAVAGVAEKVYAACKAVVDTINKIIEVVEELEKAEKALAMITLESAKDAKAIFELSPLLATHYFLSLESQALLMLDSKLLTMRGYVNIVPRLLAALQPVKDKAGEYLAASNFMFVNAKGKPFPIRAKLGNPSLMEQIKALATGAAEDAAGDLQDAAVEAATGSYVELVTSTIGIPASAS